MQTISILTLCFVLLFTVSVSGQNDEGQRFIAALSFLQSNKEVKKEIRKTFPRKLRSKKECQQYIVDSLVRFIPIYFFEGQVKPQKLKLYDRFIKDDGLFKEEYGFEPYVSENLSVISGNKTSKLILTFSKPTNNFILADILSKDLYVGGHKHGITLQMLLLFSKEGKVVEVFFSKTMYN
ncbi:MAG: hypothetical protein AAF849_02420 [Bacteroidota bacterium]